MRLRHVTDPELLNQLGIGNRSNLRPVTDPELLSQLESSTNQQNNFNPSFLEKLAPNIAAGTMQMGQSLINAPSNIAKMLEQHSGQNTLANKLGLKASDIPRQDVNFSELLKIPGTTADKVIQSIAKNAPSMAIPGANTGSFLLNAASRVLPQSAWGAATNENPIEGAKQFGGAQLAMEGLGAPFAMAGQLAEWMNPLKFAGKQASKIQMEASNAKDAMNTAYSGALNKYGEFNVTPTPKEYIGVAKKELKRFTPDINKSYKDFLEDPTLNNLHSLQSQIGKDSSSMYGNPKKINTYQTLKSTRDNINNKISSFLKQDPEALSSYEKGKQIGRDLYYPYFSNPTLGKIAEGVKQDITPENISSAIKKGKEKIKYKSEGKPITSIPEEHPLNETLNQLKNRMHIGKALQYGIPAATLGLGGSAIHPILGSAAGGLLGTALGKVLSIGSKDIAQNPAIVNALRNYMAPTMYGVGRQVAGYNM